MSKYINLEDPDVHYTQNYGAAEGYIIAPEAERIDIVRCKDCFWHNKCTIEQFLGLEGFCSKGERRTDDEAD